RNAYISISGIVLSDTNMMKEKTSIDLLAYQNGNTKSLGIFEVPARTYDHISLELDLQEDAFGNIPGCFVATQEGKKHNLYPSTLLHKVLTLPLENLEVAPDENIQLLLDFDLRKLIRYGASATEIKYQFIDDRSMEEAIRVLDLSQTGGIKGKFLDETNQDFKMLVHAYQSGTFSRSREIRASETDLPNFYGAVNSSLIDSDGEFNLPFLSKGSYQLVFCAISKGGENELIGILDATGISGSALDNIHVEPGNQVQVEGTINEILPF
ncbi:MAG: DUF4382 domain-containing protein, partial [Saprospiraceae bacterium]|nr:DUF4382 domain-containing protein [Saprospiraceae bacterium]